MDDHAAIDARGLRKSYDGREVLSGVDLSVARGQVYALLGPNGAGKTTTVRILATLTRADAGTARVAGHDVRAERSAVRRRISLTGQATSVDDLQTGAENLRMFARLAGLDRRRARRRAEDLLARLDLADAGDRRVGTYSGGMRRRLDLAVGLVGTPSVIFLDEPTTGLDPRSRQAVWHLVADLARGGAAVLLTTQYLEEADRLADRIALIDAGRVVAEGTPAELKRRFARQRLDLTMSDQAAWAVAEARLGARVTHRDPAARVLGVATGGDAAEVRDLLDDIDPQRTAVARFAVRTATLDDVFLALTGRPTAPAAPVIPTDDPELTHV